jgi:hypothetical protein
MEKSGITTITSDLIRDPWEYDEDHLFNMYFTTVRSFVDNVYCELGLVASVAKINAQKEGRI